MFSKETSPVFEAQGEMGVVKEIEIFTTKLTGLSNKEIIIPNGSLSNGTIVNYTTEGTRRVNLVFGVGYDSDIKKTKEVLLNVLTSHRFGRFYKYYFRSICTIFIYIIPNSSSSPTTNTNLKKNNIDIWYVILM